MTAQATTREPASAGVNVRRALSHALGVLACVLPLAFVVAFVPHQWARTDTMRDVSAYVLAAQHARAGESLYAPYPPPVPHDPGTLGPLYLYPPFLAAGLALLPRIPYTAFANGWLLFLLACIGAYAAVLSRLATGRVRLVPAGAAATLLLFNPGTIVALNFGQVDPLVWLLAGLALASASARGPGLALAAMLKVSPVWALGAAALREGRRTLLGAAAVTAMATALTVGVLGAGGFVVACEEWLRYVVPHLGQGQLRTLGVAGLPSWLPFNNVSVAYAPLLIAHGLGWDPVGTLPAWIRAYLALTSVGGPILAAWWTRRATPELQCSAVLTASLLSAPILRMSYLPLLLAPAAVYARERWGGRNAAGELRVTPGEVAADAVEARA